MTARAAPRLTPAGASRAIPTSQPVGKTADLRRIADVMDIGLLLPEYLQESGVGEQDVESFLADVAGLVLATDAMDIATRIVRDERALSWSQQPDGERHAVIRAAVEGAAIPFVVRLDHFYTLYEAWAEGGLDQALRESPKAFLQMVKVNVGVGLEVLRDVLVLMPGIARFFAPLIPQSVDRLINVTAMVYWVLDQGGLDVVGWIDDALEGVEPGLVERVAAVAHQLPPTPREALLEQATSGMQVETPRAVAPVDVAPPASEPWAPLGIGALIGGMLVLAIRSR